MLPFEHDVVQKGHPKVNIKVVWDFDVENISVKLQHDSCNSLGGIVFTRQPDCEQVGKFKKDTQRSLLNSSNKFKKVTQRSTLNTSKIVK